MTDASILIVDDQPANLTALESVLAPLQATVVRAAGGQEALRLGLRHGFALAILDVRMPGMDGYELARLLHGDERSRDIPIIFLTASQADACPQFLGYRAGAVDFITKPFDAEALLSKCRVFLELHRRGREARDNTSRLEALLADQERANQALNREMAIRRRAEAELAEREQQFRFIFDLSPAGMNMVGPDGRYLRVNAAFCAITGYSVEELLRLTFKDITHPDDWESDAVHVDQVNSGALDVYAATKRYIRKDGGVTWVHLSVRAVRDEAGRALYGLGTILDITERKLAEEALEASNRKLKALSHTDGLTGVPTRRHFDEVLANEYSRHARSGSELSLIMVDIDHFKAFNDSYGHVKGDECLRRIARVIAECACRPADLGARYGGEEFVCVLPDTDRYGAIAVAEKIRLAILALAIPHEASPAGRHVSASLGVATMRCAMDQTSERVVDQADALLYQAKSRGRNRVEFATLGKDGLDSPGIHPGAVARLVWKEHFSCGNSLIDAQHQSLFQTSNELLEAVRANRPEKEVSSLVLWLLGGVSKHFRDEERVLAGLGFPDVERHAEEHADLLEKTVERLQQFHGAALTIPEVFQLLVHDVVLLHLLGADREWLPYVGKVDSA